MTIFKRRDDNWIQTFTGKQFWPADPRPAEICIIDIAASLADQRRYAGHALRSYSVAEHCVHMARHPDCPNHLRLTALLHDASESYLIDVPRPTKRLLRDYPPIEENLMRHISLRFRTVWPLPRDVKNLDERILRDELVQNMAPHPAPWGLTNLDPLGINLQYWDRSRAFFEFLVAFFEFGGRT